MATPPDFTAGAVLTAAQMNAVGLWLIKTQTVGSAVSSVTVSDAFSADYDSYVITYTDGSKSADTQLRFKLGATATGYYGNLVYGHYNDTTARSVNDNNGTLFSYVGGGDSNGAGAYIVLTNPYLTKQTYISAQSSASLFNGIYNGRLANTTSYTDFTISPSSGTMTGGTIRVYGYRN